MIGIWDVLGDQEVCDVVSQHLDDAEQAAKAITERAFNKMSMDNLTCVVMIFEWNLHHAKAHYAANPISLDGPMAFGTPSAPSSTPGTASGNSTDDDDEFDMFAKH